MHPPRRGRSPRRPKLCGILSHHPRRSRSLPLDIVPSVCPHDCPSACALEVELIDGRRIGRVRGASAQSYTRGVVCAKVARYAERQHHPARLSQPMRRIGEKGVGAAAFVPISWKDALDEVAEGLTRAAQRHGTEAVWPHYYGGTTKARHRRARDRKIRSDCELGWQPGFYPGQCDGPCRASA
jgi:anaerobic selenocysteine-containing dehydrogenase